MAALRLDEIGQHPPTSQWLAAPAAGVIAFVSPDSVAPPWLCEMNSRALRPDSNPLPALRHRMSPRMSAMGASVLWQASKPARIGGFRAGADDQQRSVALPVTMCGNPLPRKRADPPEAGILARVAEPNR